MTARQLEEWRAYEEIEPFGPLQAWWQTAHVKWAIRTSQPGSNLQNLQPKDCMPLYEEEPREQTADEMLSMLTAMSGVH